MDLITARETACIWGITTRRVQALCNSGQIPAATKIGNMWVIPKGTAKPIDGRTKAAKEMEKDNK